MKDRFNLLSALDVDEVSPVFRAANRRRFALLKSRGGEMLDAELEDMLSLPWEREGAMIDALRKEGVDDAVQMAAVGALRLLKSVEDELPESVRESIVNLTQCIVAKVKAPDDVDNDADAEPDADVDDTKGKSGKKAKADADALDDVVPDGDGVLNKAEFSDQERHDLASRGQALPDGSYPIRDTSDLRNAIQALGRAKDSGRAKAWIIRRARALGATNLLPDSWSVSKEDEVPEGPTAPETPAAEVEKEGGTVADEHEPTLAAVPVQKEDGSWDLSGVPESHRPFYQAFISKGESLAADLKETRELLSKADDTLKTREYVEKAAEYTVLSPAEELGLILKEAADKLEPETYEKLTGVLKAAAERVQAGDLFKEQGANAINDGSASDAYAQLQKAAEKIAVETNVSKEVALSKALEANPELYDRYLAETMGGVA